jgi:hypothetical protein
MTENQYDPADDLENTGPIDPANPLGDDTDTTTDTETVPPAPADVNAAGESTQPSGSNGE